MSDPFVDVESYINELSFYRPHKLDSVPLLSLAQEIGDIIIGHVDTPLKYEQMKSPQVYAYMVKPIVEKIKQDHLSGGTLYSLLANRIHFGKEASSDLASAQLWTTRSTVCEIIAIKLISEFTREELAQYMVFEFYPLADGKATAHSVIPTWLRVSSLELAIHGEAKRFLSHPALVEMISDLWNGMLVFDPLLYKAHRLNMKTKKDLQHLIESHRGLICRYDLETGSKFKLSRLRVPKYRHIIKLFSMFVLVILYLSLLQGEGMNVSPREIAFSVWAFGFCLDELQSLRKAGHSLYFQTLWSTLDFMTMMLLFSYWILRVLAIANHSENINYLAYQVLATVGVGLIPRVFCILEVSEGFSRMVISVRKMSIELLYCWAAIGVFCLGFWASLSRFAAGKYASSEVLYQLFQILLGFTPAVWNTWQDYTFLGRSVLFLYLFLAHFVVMTIVIAMLSARYSEIIERSLEEHHYLLAVKTVVKIKTERSTLFCYAEPINILALLMRPLIYILPINIYLQLHRNIVKATHLPILLIIYAYEKLLWNLELRKKAQEEIQQARIQQHMVKRNWPPSNSPQNKKYPDRRRRPAPVIKPQIKLDRSMSKTSTFDLVESALRQNHGASMNTTGAFQGSSFSAAMAANNGINGLGIAPNLQSLRNPIPDLAQSDDTAFETMMREPQQHPGLIPIGERSINENNTHHKRTYSNTSSVLRNYNTLRLSPTRSYSMFQRGLASNKLMDEEIGNSDSEHEGDIPTVIADLEVSHKRIEQMLATLISRMDDLDKRLEARS